jgi:hypothetical protein
MLDFDQADTRIDVNTYRKRVLAVYSVAGFAIAGLVFLCTMDSMDDGVSTWTALALAFIGIIGVFSWVGCATANAIYSVDDGWYPWVHRWALVKSIPLGIVSVGALLGGVWVAMQIPFPGALGFIGLGYGAWVRWLVTSRERSIAP